MEQVYNHTQDTVPEVHANNLKNSYEKLKNAANLLHGAANALGDAASALKTAVGDRDAAGSGNPNNLREALAQLNTTPSGANATKVFEKFNAVVGEYNALSTKSSEVQSAFTDVHIEYSNAIYQYKWHLLTMPSIVTRIPSMLLGNIIDLFQKLYKGDTVIRAIVKKARDIKEKAEQIKNAAASGTNKLSGAADALASASDTLKTDPNVSNARAFKNKYDEFKTAYDTNKSEQAKVQTEWDTLKEIIDDASLTEENKQTPTCPATSPAVTQATLNLTSIDTHHTLTLQNTSGGDATTVQTVTVDVSEQKSNINRIKGQPEDVKINLTLNLADVILRDTTGSTLKASGSITTTKTVEKAADQPAVATALAAPHNLLFNNPDSLKHQRLTPESDGTVKIGPGSTSNSTLNLEAGAPGAGSDGAPTELTLELKAGTKSGGEDPNDQLTLTASNTLTLTGGINGTLEYSSNNGTLTATINKVKYDLHDSHDTYKM